MSTMITYFMLDSEVLYLPFSTSFEVSQVYDDEEFENILGEKYLIPGKLNLREFELTGFITKNKYSFIHKNTKTELSDYLSFFERARKQFKPLRIVVANDDVTIIDMDCLANFTYSNIDSAGDINFKIVIKEYKAISVDKQQRTYSNGNRNITLTGGSNAPKAPVNKNKKGKTKPKQKGRKK